jgi:type II secretory ATPase GspE/PulE/Tfp pilus assembly ATPase PilB-like protein
MSGKNQNGWSFARPTPEMNRSGMNSLEKFKNQLASRLATKPLPDIPGLVDDLLELAVSCQASDLHLTPFTGSGLRLELRIDGVLHPQLDLPQDISAQVVARIKVLAGLLTYRTEIPQEGRIPPDPVRQRPEVRVSTFPTLSGERAALRFLTNTDSRRNFADLGLPDFAKQKLSHFISDTSGMVIIAGPAGSGKTTTLYACLREIIQNAAGSRCLISLEDPVESAIEGVAQTSLDRRAGLGLAKLVKAVMRQDPDVIAIGEIRDRATARSAFQATLTGHLVLTTTHAGDCVEVITRLLDMKIPPYVLRSSLRGIMAQRLLRRLCPECRSRKSNAENAQSIVFNELTEYYEAGNGPCTACSGTGYQGRVLVVQWLDFGLDELSVAIQNRVDARSMRRIIAAAGVKSLRENAIEMVRQGLTTPAEMVRAFGIQPSSE